MSLQLLEKAVRSLATHVGPDASEIVSDILDAAQDQWQPIETAPQTGRSILVWCPNCKCMFTAAKFEHEEGWMHFGPNRLMDEQPTKWMPLPENPNE
jgi:hypothetical protein